MNMTHRQVFFFSMIKNSIQVKTIYTQSRINVPVLTQNLINVMSSEIGSQQFNEVSARGYIPLLANQEF